MSIQERVEFLDATRFPYFISVYFTSHTPPIQPHAMSSPALPRSENSPTPTRDIIDPLAFNDVRGLAGTAGARRNGSEAEEDNGDDVVRRPRRGPTGVNLDDIPRVKDDTGDKVMDSFVLFLEKSATLSVEMWSG